NFHPIDIQVHRDSIVDACYLMPIIIPDDGWVSPRRNNQTEISRISRNINPEVQPLGSTAVKGVGSAGPWAALGKNVLIWIGLAPFYPKLNGQVRRDVQVWRVG